MAYQVEWQGATGPLDLLLRLVEDAHVEITEVDLAIITDQYLAQLERLESVDVAELNQFIALAGRLIYLKSLALINAPEAEPDEALKELSQQLTEYRRFRWASAKLGSSFKSAPRLFRRRPRPRLRIWVEPPNLTVAALVEALNGVYNRQPAARPELVVESGPSVEVAMDQVQRTLDGRRQVELGHFLAGQDQAVAMVGFFLAVLELLKSRLIKVSQLRPFAAIILSYETET